ncbi:uncharacterized protein [Diabrotica undecimpunctata]|uniref:uncharacterized protein n=1 Tax=Diabrotica undecimpunctata TaxID=50387 RepID=UPI003B634BEF
MDMNANKGSCTEILSNECCQFLNILNIDTCNPDNCLVWEQQNDPLVVHDDVDHQNMKYEKTKPPTGGVPYEIKLITLFAVAGVKYYKNCNWRLSTQDNCAGKFDDLVCQFNTGAILIQAKTKSTCISESEVFSDSPTKTDYNLIAYILSYKNIKIKNIKYLLVCTNADIKSPLFEISKQEDKQIKNIFKRSKLFGVKLDTQTVRNIYRTIRKFKKNIKPHHKKELWKRTMVSKRDIKAFILKFRYIKISEADLGANIEEEINNFNQKVNYIYLLHQIETWYRMERNKEDYLTNLYTNSIFYGEKSRHLTEMYLDPSINFETMHKMYENKIVFVKPGIHYHWSLRRIVQSLRHFDKKPDNMFYNQILFIQENEINFINLFKLNKFKYLIICLPISTNDQVKNVCQILEKIMDGNSKKLAFFVANETSYSNNNVVTSLEDKISLSWFDSTSKKTLLNREIVFQFPNKTLKLQELLNCGQDLEQHIDEHILTRLRDLNTFYIGRYVKSLENIKYCHINRSLTTVTGLKVSNHDFFDTLDKRVFVLVGPPGSGKSTYLVKVAHLKKERSPQTWIIHLDIGSVIKFLEKHKDEPLMNLFYQLEGAESNFEKELMKSLEKYVLIDGFIELNTTYLSYFQKMINLLLQINNVSKIFIALRDNHISIQALKTVKEVEILTINPFSMEDQQTYFNKAIQSLENNSNFHIFVKTFTKLNSLMSIPLYMSLLLEIFVESENQTAIILTRDNVYEIYNYFLKIKKRLFALEHTEENSVLFSILDDTFERYLNDMRLIAVKNVFANTDCDKFFELVSIHDFVLRIGIIEKSYDEYIFRHKTFEEHLSAEYIWKLVCIKSKKILSELLDVIFFNFEYAGICSFFDNILQIVPQENLTKISEVYCEIFSEPERIENADFRYLAQQGNINILKLFLAKSNDCSKLLSKRYPKGRTVLHYSATYPKLVEFLVENGADINALDDKGYGICHYAISAYLSEMYNKSMKTEDVYALARYLMIERDDFLDNIVDEFGNTLLHYFCMDNQLLEIVQFLFNRNTSLCTIKNLSGNTPLHFAAHNDAHEIIRYFVNEQINIDIDILRVKNLVGDSLIHSASSGNAVNVLHYFKQSHKEIFMDLIELENDHKHTALDHAFLNCAYEAIQYLEGN